MILRVARAPAKGVPEGCFFYMSALPAEDVSNYGRSDSSAVIGKAASLLRRYSWQKNKAAGRLLTLHKNVICV